MQEVEIDNHILIKPPTLIDEKHLDLKLNTSGNITSQKLIEQINEKINYLDSQKATVEDFFNKEITSINNSENGDITDLSSKIKEPLQTADSISSDIEKIKDRFFIIKKNIEKLMQLKDSDQKREMLKKLKEETLRLKDFYEVYERLKYFYENRDFIQVSILYNQIKKLNIGDKIKLVDDLLSPANLMKAINDELFKICQKEFSFMSLFQCLLFIKDPSEVVQIITYNKKFDFKGITNFDQIIDNYGYRFDVIYAISKLKNQKNIVDVNGKPWNMPSEIWNALSNPKINFFNIVAQSFYNFIYNLNTRQNPLLPILLNKWDSIESLLFITNSYSIIAFKIVSDILKNGNQFNSDSDPMNKTGLLFQNLNECYIIYQSQNEKNYYQNSYSCDFVKNLIESIVVLLIRSLINNPFNQSQDHSKEMVDYFNDKSKAILKSDSLLDELKIKSKIDFELIQSDFQKIFKVMDENSSLMNCFYEDNFFDRIISSFIPKFLYYSVPAFIGENVKDYCQNEEKFNSLKLKETFSRWSATYKISEGSLRKIALKYFNFCKPRSLFLLRFIEPDNLFSIHYPPPPS